MLTGEETRSLFDSASTYAAKLGLTVSSIPKPEKSPGLMGYWDPADNLIWVRPDAPQDQRTKTFLHEIAHSRCHLRGARDAEVMAESVAYTVANHFGFDTGVRSFPYVALWAQDVKVLKSNLDTIRKVATEMIDGIEQVAQLTDSRFAELENYLRGETTEMEQFKGLYCKECGKEYATWRGLEGHFEKTGHRGIGSLLVSPEFLAKIHPEYADTEAEVGRNPCREISQLLRESPWGAESMLNWAERLKVLADGAEGCQSLQEKAYQVAYQVIQVAQPMLTPAKVADCKDEELAEVVRALEEAEVISG